MEISLEDVIKKRDELISLGHPAVSTLQILIKWLGDNESSLSPQASQYFSTLLDNFFKAAEENTKKMEDSPEKRQAMRMAASGLEKHHAATNMLKGLEREPPDQDDLLKDWSAKVLKVQQSILDFLFDITQSENKIKHTPVMLGLMYACIDEYTVAHHLARHHYYFQANNHLRTIIETLDRIELFIKDSTMVDLWASEDKKKIRQELRPSKVRERLGRETFDPIYGYLSENGTHPTFDMFKGRALKNATPGVMEARIFVAGTPLRHLRMFHYSFNLIVGNMFLSRLTNLFKESLNLAECSSVMEKLSKDILDHNDKYFIPWAKENDIDVREFIVKQENFKSSDS